jgi:hypothetical protein
LLRRPHNYIQAAKNLNIFLGRSPDTAQLGAVFGGR